MARKGRQKKKSSIVVGQRKGAADIETASEYATIDDLKKKAGFDEEEKMV